MIVAFEFQNEIAPGVSAGQALGNLDGLAAARRECDAFGAGNQTLDLFRNRDFQLMLSAVAEGQLRLPSHGCYQPWVLVPENHRSPCKLVVDIFIALDVTKLRTAAVLEIKRNRRFGAERAADAAGQRLPGSLEQSFGSVPTLDHFAHSITNLRPRSTHFKDSPS